MANQDNKTRSQDLRKQPEQQREQGGDKTGKPQKNQTYQTGEKPRQQPDQNAGSRH